MKRRTWKVCEVSSCIKLKKKGERGKDLPDKEGRRVESVTTHAR